MSVALLAFEMVTTQTVIKLLRAGNTHSENAATAKRRMVMLKVNNDSPRITNSMKTLTIWNPFKEMNNLSSFLENWPSNLPASNRRWNAGVADVADWAPSVDITEDDSGYLFKVELPAVRKEDLKIQVEDGVLTIQGERNYEKEEKTTLVHRIERAYGKFARSFTLPEDGDPSQVKAEFKDGLLEVHVAKDEKAKPKTIEIKIS